MLSIFLDAHTTLCDGKTGSNKISFFPLQATIVVFFELWYNPLLQRSKPAWQKQMKMSAAECGSVEVCTVSKTADVGLFLRKMDSTPVQFPHEIRLNNCHKVPLMPNWFVHGLPINLQFKSCCVMKAVLTLQMSCVSSNTSKSRTRRAVLGNPHIITANCLNQSELLLSELAASYLHLHQVTFHTDVSSGPLCFLPKPKPVTELIRIILRSKRSVFCRRIT